MEKLVPAEQLSEALGDTGSWGTGVVLVPTELESAPGQKRGPHHVHRRPPRRGRRSPQGAPAPRSLPTAVAGPGLARADLLEFH
jgi:hypothetical protein